MNTVQHVWKKHRILLAQTALHLEGIHLDEVETKDLLESNNKRVLDVDEEDAIVIRNVIDTLNYLETLDFTTIQIDLDLYITLNTLLANEQALSVGKLRDCNTSIGCIEEDIPVFDKELIIREIDRLNFVSTENYKKIIPEVFCKLSRMQPFFDGNKRSTSYLCNISLIKNNIGIFYIDFKNLSDFNLYLKEYYQEKNNKILDFIANTLIRIPDHM